VISSLTFLSYNIWGLKLGPINISSDFSYRLKFLPKKLAETNADIIFLQEVWYSRDKKFLIKEMKKYGYSNFLVNKENKIESLKRKFRGVLGDGLVILSKYPLCELSKEFLSFKEYTATEEWFVSKGAFKVSLNIPKLGKIDIYNSHMGSVDFIKNDNDFSQGQMNSRYKQAEELLDFISGTCREGLVFLGVDMNSHEFLWNSKMSKYVDDKYSKEYKLLTQKSGFCDSYRFFNSDSKGYTFCNTNFYKREGHDPSARLDCIFSKSNKFEIKPQMSKIVLNKPIKSFNKNIYLSDHYGVLTKFKIQ
jgi:exonuclease III